MRLKDVILRKATIADCRNLSELNRDVWITTYSGIYPQEKLDGYGRDNRMSGRRPEKNGVPGQLNSRRIQQAIVA